MAEGVLYVAESAALVAPEGYKKLGQSDYGTHAFVEG
jgi:hypothetical protein